MTRCRKVVETLTLLRFELLGQLLGIQFPLIQFLLVGGVFNLMVIFEISPLFLQFELLLEMEVVTTPMYSITRNR